MNKKYEKFIRICQLETNIDILKSWYNQNKIAYYKYVKSLHSLNKKLRKYKLQKLYE